MASCKAETAAYRQCLKDSHASGCSNGGSRCASKAKTLEACRAQFRKANQIEDTRFDGTRVLPHQKCRPFNKKVQHCLKWKQGDQSHCQTDIRNLKECMDREKGVVVAPTAGDKLWSDYKAPKGKGNDAS